MTKYYVGSDHCYDGASGSQHHIDVVAEALQQAGNEVEKCGVGPNKESVVRQHAGEDAIVVFIACGIDGCTEWSIKEAIRSGNGCKCVFAYTGFAVTDPSKPLYSAESCDSFKIGASWDAGQYLSSSSKASCEGDIAGRTHKEYFEANSQYIAYCYSKESIEDLAQKVVDGNYFGGGGSTSSGGGGSVVYIPDRTFWGLIRQITGATDSIFITANNMAYMLSFEDYYKYREEFLDLLPTLEVNTVIPDSIEKGWVSEGFYNAVEVEYNGGILKYQHDALVKQYGLNVYHHSLPDDDYETAKSKAAALLSAHVRDYGTDIKLTCIYNPNITVGSWVKVRKSITNIQGATTESVADMTMGIVEDKPQNLNITNMQEKMQPNQYGIPTKYELYVDKDGNKREVETNSDDYEVFFVQGYSIRWSAKYALMMDIHLKYGPDTPDAPINATIGIGGGATGGTSGDAMTGDDCFGVTTSQLHGDHRIPHSGAGGIEYARANPPSAETVQGRCKAGSSYASEVNGKTPAEVFFIATQKFVYCCYADNCHLYSCNEERWDSNECGFNCGDSATILKSLLDCIGVKNWIFHIHGHYHQMVEIDGQIQSADLSRRVDKYTHTVGWPAAQRGQCSCPCYSC